MHTMFNQTIGGNMVDMTETEYIRHMSSIWGEDYIFDLIERGYMPTETSEGWRFILATSDNGLDTDVPSCYASGVGVRA